MNVKTNSAALRNEFAPLYHRYPEEGYAQKAFIYINPRRATAYADYDTSTSGAHRFDIECNRIILISVPGLITGAEIADFLDSPQVLALLSVICEGHSTFWNVWNDASHIGVLTPAAEAALGQLSALAEAELTPTLTACPVADWLQGVRIGADASDADLTAMAREFTKEAQAEKTVLEGDVFDGLAAKRLNA